MNTHKSISGYLSIDSERFYLTHKNEPIPEELLKVKPGDTFIFEVRVVVLSVEINSNTDEVSKAYFGFESLEKITQVIV